MYKYFKVNRKTIISLYTLLGAYCTGAVGVLFIVTGFELTSVLDVVYLFLTCLIIGHLFAFSLVLMYLSVNYQIFRDRIKFFDKIGADLKEEFKIILYNEPIRQKYGLSEVRIYCLWQDYLFNLTPNSENKEVGISVINVLDDFDFIELTKYIDKQYRFDSICMTGFGIRKTIGLKEWNSFEIGDVACIFRELVALSAKEKIDVVTFDDLDKE